nr:MAG TPA: hypothetical protein [Caudoviricetes sp.]
MLRAASLPSFTTPARVCADPTTFSLQVQPPYPRCVVATRTPAVQRTGFELRVCPRV